MKAISNEAMDEALQTYLESVKDIENYSEAPIVTSNPFRSNLKSSIEMKYKTEHAINSIGTVEIRDTITGEITSGVGENRIFTRRKFVDNEAFVKIYLNRFRDVMKLSISAIKVFNYLLGEMQKPENINKDQIYFEIKDCMEFCGYTTHNMVYNGLTELISHGFVARSDKPYLIYVDSNVAFNGNRILVFEEYIRKEADHFDDKSLKE